MEDIKARKKLSELALRWNHKSYTPDNVLKIYKNSEKYAIERQMSIMSGLIKPHVSNYDEVKKQYDLDITKNKKTPFDAFVKCVNSAQIATEKPKIAVKPTKGDFIESPTLSSTRVEKQRRSEITEIKEKLAAATQQSFHQSTTQSSATFLRQSLNSSSGSVKSVKSTPYTPKDGISSWNFSFGDDTILPMQLRVPKPIIGLPVAAQERTIITELLSVLIGINGTLIVPKLKVITYDEDDFMRNSMPNCKISVVEFELNEQIQESIRDILGDILPLANYYFQIQNFVDYSAAPESGQVLQALSYAVSKLITDYYGTIAQLEQMHIKQELNLHKMIFYLRPIIQTMETVTKVCNMLLAHNTRGGNVLTSLHDNIALFSGDKSSQQILIYLTQKAAEPYMEILKLWLYKGIIIDKKNEFFVEDNEKECRNPDENENYFDHFWEKRYVLKSEKIPRFLEKQADMIAKTGKYLNVVRECGKRVVFNQAQASIKFSHTDEQNYVNIITDAYTFASKSLLELIMDDNDLMGHLLSVKRYFLIQQGDFIVQFMDACESELMKSVDEIIPMRLENLLELTLRMSSAKHDKYQDNLYTTFFSFDICTQMSKIIQSGGDDEFEDELVDYSLRCIEYFVFGYNVQWPLSIVLNQLTMSKYQLIFRQLFYCKFVENYLCRVWIENKNAKKFDQKTSEQYRAAFTLRQRMLTAIQNLEYYMMIEVIEPVWHNFMQQLAKAKNIDDVLNYHEDFLDHCLKNCMLTHPDLLKRIVAVAKDCISFCEFIEEAQRHFIDAELSSMMSSNYIQDECTDKQNPSATEDSEIKNLTFSESVAKFDSNFTKNIVRLLDSVFEIAEKDNTEKFISLCNRLNFNNYYTGLLSARR